jgi:nicotinate-nucleotide adenylyltransferase
MKVGILGGSFDPVHNGHIELALYVKSAYKLDKIMFLPLGDPPHKTLRSNKEIRVKMLKEALKNVDDCFVSTLEVERQGTTYTFDTVSWLKANTDDEYYYIIGGDTVDTLHKWHRAEELFKIINFIVIDRLNIDETEGIKRVKQMGAKLYIADHTGLDISSTQVRDYVKNGKNIDELVPYQVKEIIVQHGLYKN